ncbi:MAG TPA: SDR family NAD(P)-dependent oxidoreductase [Streptosporangiaceae bacterium]|nr:SDR family NAD(P)-dependent oxidoreductase [Streptosporangiaceae bacterium]
MRAVVTGAARGLGEAVAARLAAGGASVALIDISPQVTAAAGRIAAGLAPGAAGRTTAIVADVAGEATCQAAIDRAAAELGGIDALVNNAGVGGPDTRVVDTAFDDFWAVLRVNLGSVFLASRAAARLMITRNAGGAIVNLGSIFGQQGVPGGAGYCASKAAVALLTQSLALELAPHGIRVNTIAPGNMATEMHWDELRSRARAAGTTFEEQVDLVARSVPLGRHGTGDDIAGVVAWLVSADAGYVTGQTIGVNGGVWLS